LGGASALVAEDTKSLSLLTQTRGQPRALAVVALSAVALGVAVGASFGAGRYAAAATHHDDSLRLSAAVRQGLDNAALRQAGVQTALVATPVSLAAVPIQLPAIKPDTALALLSDASTPFRLDGPVQASRDLDCLTAAVYYEARGESASGQAAVAQVVLNRVRHPAFPKSVCAVVYQGAASHSCQFSFACNGAMRGRKEAGAWDRARDVAARALSGYVMDAVGRATHFRVVSLGQSWGGGMIRVAQIGQHNFYAFSGRRSILATGIVEPSSAGADLKTLVSASAPARLASADAATSAVPATSAAVTASAVVPSTAAAATTQAATHS
jgi:hypothetical protein